MDRGLRAYVIERKMRPLSIMKLLASTQLCFESCIVWLADSSFRRMCLEVILLSWLFRGIDEHGRRQGGVRMVPLILILMIFI